MRNYFNVIVNNINYIIIVNDSFSLIYNTLIILSIFNSVITLINE